MGSNGLPLWSLWWRFWLHKIAVNLMTSWATVNFWRRLLLVEPVISNAESSCLSKILVMQQDLNYVLTHTIVRSVSQSVSGSQGRIIFGNFWERTSRLVIKVAPNACILALSGGEGRSDLIWTVVETKLNDSYPHLGASYLYDIQCWSLKKEL